ncbi:glycosyl transferase group 1 [Stanieria sp. NIES-3757]|nr:glycosyl transferase group 1 [Stanieria sp. NIES-3757]
MVKDSYKQNLSIAFFVWGLSSDAITNCAAALAEGFSQLGVKRIYILYLNGSPEENINFPKGVEFIHLGVYRARESPIPIAHFLKSYKPDFLISLAFLNIPAILGWLYTNRKFAKLIVSQQHSLIYKAHVEHKRKFLPQAELWLAPFLYSMSSGLVSTSQTLLVELVKQVKISLPQKRIAAIPNPVNCQLIVHKAQATVDHPWLKRKIKPVIISVARLAKQKNFPLLLNAFSLVLTHIDAKLIILGEGSERKSLEKLTRELDLENKVSFPGECQNPWKYMSKADLFVLPSQEEAFGLVLVEAMACGLPVIATDAIAGGPRSIINDNRYGLLIANKDVNALADAIIKVLTLPDLRAQLITASAERCRDFEPRKIAQEWFSFLQQL